MGKTETTQARCPLTEVPCQLISWLVNHKKSNFGFVFQVASANMGTLRLVWKSKSPWSPDSANFWGFSAKLLAENAVAGDSDNFWIFWSALLVHHGHMHRGYMCCGCMYCGNMHHGHMHRGYMHHGYMHHGYNLWIQQSESRIHASWTHLHGSHSLSARRARRTNSSRPEGPKANPKGHQLEDGARRASKLLVIS